MGPQTGEKTNLKRNQQQQKLVVNKTLKINQNNFKKTNNRCSNILTGVNKVKSSVCGQNVCVFINETFYTLEVKLRRVKVMKPTADIRTETRGITN